MISTELKYPLIHTYTAGDILRGNIAPNPESLSQQLRIPVKFFGNLFQGITDSYATQKDEHNPQQKANTIDGLERAQYIWRFAHQIIKSPVFVGDENSVGSERAIRIWKALYLVLRGKLGLNGLLDWHIHPNIGGSWMPSPADVAYWSSNKETLMHVIAYQEYIALYVETTQSQYIGGVVPHSLDFDFENKSNFRTFILSKLEELGYYDLNNRTYKERIIHNLKILRHFGYEVYICWRPMDLIQNKLPDSLEFNKVTL